MKENLPVTLLVSIGIALLTIAVNVLPAYIKMDYKIFLIYSSIFSIAVLVFLGVFGYKIGKSDRKRNAFYSGLIIGLIVGLTSGFVTPYIQNHSKLYQEMLSSFISNIAHTKTNINLTKTFTVGSYIAGSIVTAFFYSIIMSVGAFFGGMKKTNEETI